MVICTGAKDTNAFAEISHQGDSVFIENVPYGARETTETGLRLEFGVDEDRRVVCNTRISDRFQGLPGHVHGGIIAPLLDEAMSKANRQFGILAMTRQMEVEYLKPVPLDTAIRITAYHRSAYGRNHHCEAKITSEAGAILAEISLVRMRRAGSEYFHWIGLALAE